MRTVTINMDLRMDEEIRANVEEETLLLVQLIDDDEQDDVVDDRKKIPFDALELEVERLDQLLAVGIGVRRVAAKGKLRGALLIRFCLRSVLTGGSDRLAFHQITTSGHAVLTAVDIALAGAALH
jgi:hypothetical protein